MCKLQYIMKKAQPGGLKKFPAPVDCRKYAIDMLKFPLVFIYSSLQSASHVCLFRMVVLIVENSKPSADECLHPKWNKPRYSFAERASVHKNSQKILDSDIGYSFVCNWSFDLPSNCNLGTRLHHKKVKQDNQTAREAEKNIRSAHRLSLVFLIGLFWKKNSYLVITGSKQCVTRYDSWFRKN